MRTELALVLLLAFAAVFWTVEPALADMAVSNNWDGKGELTISGEGWRAVFQRQSGRVSLSAGEEGKVRLRVISFDADGRNTERIQSCKPSKTSDGVAVEVIFVSDGNRAKARFLFDSVGTMKVEPAERFGGLEIEGEIEFALVPSPPLEDIIYDPARISSAVVHVPSENLLMGLMERGDGAFFCAWGEGGQRVALRLQGDDGKRFIKTARIELDGKPLFLRLVALPGIWHRERLKADSLERDVEIDWRRPFDAKWKTELLEGGIRTTFIFRNKKGKKWRPVLGFYTFPVWFEGERTMFHLSKKVRPPDYILIYALDGHNDTPVGMAKEKLGSVPSLTPIVHLGRYPKDTIGIQNCDGRGWVMWIFRLGLQRREREILREVFKDFLFSIRTDCSRLEEYPAFMTSLKKRLISWREGASRDELRSFFDRLIRKLEQAEQEYWRRLENKRASEHLKVEIALIEGLNKLVDEEGTEIYPEAYELLRGIRMWGRIEVIPGRVGGMLRELFAMAGYDCADAEAAVPYAERIRRDIRNFLLTRETHETLY